jgi:ABC-type Fe3+-hydroxamate transport system substrate-binding protein
MTIGQFLRRGAALAVALGVAIGLAQTAMAQPTPPGTVSITDAIGRTVTVKSPVDRVVVTFNYEEFTAIAGTDGWKRVVGITRAVWEGWRPAIFSRYAAVIPNLAAMPDVGQVDDSTFSAEKVIALRPDVLILPEWAMKPLETARAQIEAAGIPIVVIDYNAQILDRHLASTRAIGKVMGTTARAEELATLYETRHRDVMARVERAQKAGVRRPKAYVELGQAGPDTIGNTYNNSMWGQILTSMGAENIAVGRIPGPWGPLSQEAVIAANPDVIFIAGSSWLNRPQAVRTGYDMDADGVRRSLAPYAARPAWAGLSAVRTGNVNAIEHGLSRTLFDFVAMEFIGKRLYPEQFADVDPDRSFREYHEKYLPVPFSGAWMVPLKP